MSNRTPISGADLLKTIRPQLAEESTEICLRPDLIAQWEVAEEELTEAVASSGQGARLGSKAPQGQAELAEKVQDLERQIQEASATFHFRAMSKDEWRALCDDHPPRKGNEVDLFAGYNRDAVLDAAVRASLIDPVFDDDSWAKLMRVISPGEWEELRKTANAVNKGVPDAPKSALASSILMRRDSGSGRPAATE